MKKKSVKKHYLFFAFVSVFALLLVFDFTSSAAKRLTSKVNISNITLNRKSFEHGSTIHLKMKIDSNIKKLKSIKIVYTSKNDQEISFRLKKKSVNKWYGNFKIKNEMELGIWRIKEIYLIQKTKTSTNHQKIINKKLPKKNLVHSSKKTIKLNLSKGNFEIFQPKEPIKNVNTPVARFIEINTFPKKVKVNAKVAIKIKLETLNNFDIKEISCQMSPEKQYRYSWDYDYPNDIILPYQIIKLNYNENSGYYEGYFIPMFKEKKVRKYVIKNKERYLIESITLKDKKNNIRVFT